MKMNKIYDYIIKEGSITEKCLLNLGLTETEVTNIIRSGKLVKRDGQYIPGDLEDFYLYGEELYKVRNYSLSQKCFRLCLSLDSHFYPAIIRLAGITMRNKKYSKTIRHLELLKTTGNPSHINSFNFYLYLLSYTIKLSPKYKEYLSKLSKMDFMLPQDEESNEITEQNKMRKYILDGQFYEGLQVFSQIKKKSTMSLGETILTEYLLLQAKAVAQQKIFSLESMVTSGNYEKIIEILSKEVVIHFLRPIEESYLNLATDIQTMKKTDRPIMPTNRQYSIKNHQNIARRQYEKAYLFNLSFAHRIDLPRENNYLRMLLEKALEIKYELMRKNSKSEVNPSLDQLTLFTTSLFAGDYRMANDALEVYLESFGKEEYAYLVESLIAVDTLRTDTHFYRPLIFLGDILNETILFNLDNLANEIDRCLNEEKLKEAEILLDMITEAIQKKHIINASSTWITRISNLKFVLASKKEIASNSQMTLQPISSEENA